MVEYGKLLSDPNVFCLPWATLVTLASGCMGYFIAHVGTREHHKQIEVAFSALVFGVIAAFGYQVALHSGDSLLVAAVYASIIACLAGSIWWVWGSVFFFVLLLEYARNAFQNGLAWPITKIGK